MTAYARPQAVYDSPTAPYNVAIADEDWVVAIDRRRRAGEPRIKDTYEIRNFLEADDQFNCSGGESLNC